MSNPEETKLSPTKHIFTDALEKHNLILSEASQDLFCSSGVSYASYNAINYPPQQMISSQGTVIRRFLYKSQFSVYNTSGVSFETVPLSHEDARSGVIDLDNQKTFCQENHQHNPHRILQKSKRQSIKEDPIQQMEMRYIKGGSAAISLPISKKMEDKIYKSLVSNLSNCGNLLKYGV